MALSINTYLTTAIALAMLVVGGLLKRKIAFFEKFCIPSSVVGGLLFAIVHLVLHSCGIVTFVFDGTIKDICMMAFFTTIGFQADVSILKKSGFDLIKCLILVSILIVLQNLVSVLIAVLMGVTPLLGMCTGSIPMVGGHGTSAAFGPILESFGFVGASSFCAAAATFGLVMGSLVGGPLAGRIVRKYNLSNEDGKDQAEVVIKGTRQISFENFFLSVSEIFVAMGLGTIVSSLISKTGLVCPSYIGSMIVAAIMRNVFNSGKTLKIVTVEINEIGAACLSIFVSSAMIDLKIWQLAELAVPTLVMLAAQTVLMVVFARFVVFNVMGRDYDSAEMVAGICGFGMGATPNGLANMNSVSMRYGYSRKAFMIIPIIGGLFADFINSGIITVFLNVISK